MSGDQADPGERPVGRAPAEFVRRLREEVRCHRAIAHPFLSRFSAGGLARWQIWGYASQHYRLVCFFTSYLEAVAGRTPDPQVREWLREILEDEYVKRQSYERSHPTLYRRLLRAIGFEEGTWENVPWLPATRAFVQTHVDLTLRGWLLGLGAIGPGHEWAIPLMFPFLLTGIERSLPLDPAALEYFRLHIDLDVEHGRVLEDVILRWAEDRGGADGHPGGRALLPLGPCRRLDRPGRASFPGASGEPAGRMVARDRGRR